MRHQPARLEIFEVAIRSSGSEGLETLVELDDLRYNSESSLLLFLGPNALFITKNMSTERLINGVYAGEERKPASPSVAVQRRKHTGPEASTCVDQAGTARPVSSDSVGCEIIAWTEDRLC
jgi:hypothetical protein